jgi:peptide/nickel transport system permease protein
VDNAVTAAVKFKRRIRFHRRTWTLCISGLLLAMIIGVFIAGICISDDMVAADFSRKNLAPSWEHLFGTDWMGRDMLLRTIKGLSISITVGLVGSGVSAVIATIVGIVAAAGSKGLDSFINWLIDLVMGVPHLVLMILISFVCGKGLTGLLIGLAATHWTSLARLIRSEVLQIRSQQYIAVSRKLGHNSGWILLRHILPHMVPQFIIGLVLLFPHAILHESSLSFLGFGLPPEQPAIGIILSESMKYLSSGMWWLAVFPGLLLLLLVLLFEKLGDNLRRLLDPYSAHE